MKILTQDTFWDKLLDLAKDSGHVVLTSFNMYAGITTDGKDWSEIYPSKTRDFLEALPCDSEVIVCPPPLIFCDKDKQCPHCKLKYISTLTRMIRTVEVFHYLNWRISKRSHTKCYLFDTADGVQTVLGGFNLTSSDYKDLGILLEPDDLSEKVSNDIDLHIDQIREASQPINDGGVDSLDLLMDTIGSVCSKSNQNDR